LFGPLVAAVAEPYTYDLNCVNEPFTDVIEPFLDRSPLVELVSQALASAFLAAVMRAPIGTAFLVAFMGQSDNEGVRDIAPSFIALLVMSNLVALYVNPLSGLGNVYDTGEPAAAAQPTGDTPPGTGTGTLGTSTGTGSGTSTGTGGDRDTSGDKPTDGAVSGDKPADAIGGGTPALAASEPVVMLVVGASSMVAFWLVQRMHGTDAQTLE